MPPVVPSATTRVRPSCRHLVYPLGGFASPAVHHLDHRPGGQDDHDRRPPERQATRHLPDPSGNIACAAEDAGAVRCDISQFTYTPPSKPDYCDVDWGYAFAIEPDASVKVLCAGDTVHSPDRPKPAAGTSVVIGRSVCEIQARSIKCVVSETDGGLFPSPKRYYTSFEE